MTMFDQREKEFETRFKHDQELQFKITARRNRLLGLWAAQHLGLCRPRGVTMCRDEFVASLLKRPFVTHGPMPGTIEAEG